LLALSWLPKLICDASVSEFLIYLTCLDIPDVKGATPARLELVPGFDLVEAKSIVLSFTSYGLTFTSLAEAVFDCLMIYLIIWDPKSKF
jgi:hypothetical protein